MRVFVLTELEEGCLPEFVAFGSSLEDMADKLGYYANHLAKEAGIEWEYDMAKVGYYVEMIMKVRELYDGDPKNNGFYPIYWQSGARKYKIVAYPNVALFVYDLDARMPLDGKAFKQVIDFDNPLMEVDE